MSITHHSPLPTPHSHAEADNLLRRKCEIAARLKRIEARMNDAIRKATEMATAEGAELKMENSKIDRALKAYFATLTQEQLGGRKSVKLNFGIFGKRSGREKVSLIRGWNWEMVIAALKSHHFVPAFLRVTEEVNKAAVLACDADNRAVLEQHCGLRVEPGDTFYVEPDEKVLADYSSHADSGTPGGRT
jgi:phage host-nuclease inhibitor protein Gam